MQQRFAAARVGCRAVIACALTGLLSTGVASALPAVAPDVSARIAALDCAQVRAADVEQTLAHAPAPRIVALQGSVPIVTMDPFAAFLEAMGYPAQQLVQPGSSSRSWSSHVDSRKLAGHVAWIYEREGMMPMLIGHSQGGMIVIKTLHDLAGTRDASPIAVWEPGRDAPEDRTTIVDPLTGATRDVRSLRVEYAAALATGSLPRLLLGQWGMLPLLHDVPDSVVEFTGFSIPWDPIAGTGATPPAFHATARARVRNVVLPSTYSHIGLPRAAHLAGEPVTRAWIDGYRPDVHAPLPEGVDTTNLLHAADIWYSVRRHWCEAAKRLASRATGSPR